MVININKKPIKIEEEPEEKAKTLPYFIVSCVGYVSVLWLMDLVCYTFFSIHPLPFMTIITKFLSWIGVL